MGDEIKGSNDHLIRPSFFGDRYSLGNAPTFPSRVNEEERKLTFRTYVDCSDSLSDVEVMIVQPGEDVDQQFWGDNELDSTSQSDMELSKCNSELWREKIPDIPHCSYSKRKKEFSGPPARKRRRVKHRWQPSSSLYSKAILRCHNKPGNNRIQTSFNERLIRFRKMPHPASLTNTYSSSTESDTTVINPLSKVTFKLPTEKRSRGNYTSQSSTDDDNGLVKGVESSPGDDCPSCKQRPKDAIIVHGGIGHQCYCYECTMKLWRSHANCPMCHQRIRKVVRNIPF